MSIEESIAALVADDGEIRICRPGVDLRMTVSWGDRRFGVSGSDLQAMLSVAVDWRARDLERSRAA